MTETREFHQLNDSLLQEYQRFCESAFPASVQFHMADQAQGFFRRHPAPADWSAALSGAAPENEAVLTFLALTGRLQVPYADLVVDKLPLERLFRVGMADLKRWFEEAAHALGYGVDFCEKEGIRCWLYWAALEGRRPAEVTVKGAQDLRTALAGAACGSPWKPRAVRSALFGVHKVLHSLGVLPSLPKRSFTGKLFVLPQSPWGEVHPEIVESVERYLEQVATIRRPATVKATKTALTHFFRWLLDEFPEVTSVKQLERRHIERWKSYLWTRPGLKRAPQLSTGTRRAFLYNLATFFRNIAAWDWSEAPARQLVFPNDYPTKDEPLPRFLPDDAAAALLKAAEATDDLFARAAVTLLLRTGLRRSEMIGLTVDSVVRIGSSDWLRVPVGKLHNDRYIPVHPDVKRCLDEWMAVRGHQEWSALLFVRYGEPISHRAVAAAVQRVATAAGLGRVTPHQLRHTLATQAVNRGMSLESIAAMLGHRSLEMTLVYARIANRTVEKEYFNVTRQLDQHTNIQVAIPEGPGMANLRKEMDWRRLGNGYCTRPKKMPCEYETICETCTMFMTTHEFLPTLQIQREDAERKGQAGRVRVFCDLIAKVQGA